MSFKKRSFAFIFPVLLLSFQSFGQDLHFSNVEMSPLTLNPSLAGLNHPLQVISNYRSQWTSVAIPYTSIAASVDGRFYENNTGYIAGGINFFNDKSGDNTIASNQANVSLAYHLKMDRKNTFGLGLYGGFGQRTFGLGNAQWASQYDGSTYNATISSGEVIDNAAFTYMDAGAGIVYSYRESEGYMTQNNQRQVNAGLALHHLNRPDYSFYSDGSERLYMRFSIFANAIIGVSNSNGAIVPGVYVNLQKKSNEILYGSFYRFALNDASQITGRIKPFYFHLGLFHRWGDALIPKMMLEWHTFTAGFAYDVNISSLNRSSGGQGGFELFLRYKLEKGALSTSRVW